MQNTNVRAGNATEIAIIGAGPYGLSIAAHLAAANVPFRIFGKPMSAWSTQMPQGMHLKSEGFASSLSHPEGKFALRDFCREQGIPYKETGLPVELETFVKYGLAFQRKFVPSLEEKLVRSVLSSMEGFELELEDGEKLYARKVVVATGIGYYTHVPEVLASLPQGSVSHSSEHCDLQSFRGRRVAVVGSGASALDLLTLLHESGASVELIARSSTIRFHDPPGPRSLKNRIAHPRTGLGSGMQLVFYTHAPRMFRLLPEKLRLDRVRKTLGPAPGWFVKDRIAGKVPFHLGVEIARATAEAGKVKLALTGGNEQGEVVGVDHVIAATGYRTDLDRLKFLHPSIRQRIRLTQNAPALSSNFESSVPGLYFVGVSAANTFGPLMRFAYGSSFAAGSLARHFRKLVRQVPVFPRTERAEICERS